jgi:hypothetical protein
MGARKGGNSGLRSLILARDNCRYRDDVRKISPLPNELRGAAISQSHRCASHLMSSPTGEQGQATHGTDHSFSCFMLVQGIESFEAAGGGAARWTVALGWRPVSWGQAMPPGKTSAREARQERQLSGQGQPGAFRRLGFKQWALSKAAVALQRRHAARLATQPVGDCIPD